MPGLPQKNAQSVGSVSANGIWSKHCGEVTSDQLQKFWSELPPHTRRELLRIDKQTLFEQARKNLYCSRCNGLLLEGFSQIVMYGKSLQQEGGGGYLTSKLGTSKDDESVVVSCSGQDDVQDPSVHPWGGLATTKDGILTLLDCFLDGKSLGALQNVFDSARARERERELLYPDACGGGGRGWISQGIANYGRVHGTRETCALHTARLSCDTLVDFWSALGDETRHSLLRMKEEDFIERLMYRDCRRNVIREFKELKELKRMRREPRCTNWFCVADTAFQYEVSEDTVQADWHQSFTDVVGTYHHFEWAVGTGEGKSDILEFEDVGTNGSVQVNGLDLGGLTACFITLRAWRLDGRCTELTVKAHALKGQPCVHRRLIVGDGFVTITKGESIRSFFEHAEEAEEEEDDDSMDKDGNELDGDGSRPQKHAKSPELAREFLLDAATVIFKEQVEKAFREGTARQNAHSIFVCLALKLLEERVHVACKEIITLEKQMKLLEEEEKEKREEEERKERRRTKEREKKLRRKERLKGKEREREKQCVDEHKQPPIASLVPAKESSFSVHDESHNNSSSGDSISETGDNILSSPLSSDITDEQSSNGIVDGELSITDSNGSFTIEQSKSSRRKFRFKKDVLLDQASRWCERRQPISVNECAVPFDETDQKLHGDMSILYRCINGPHRLSRNNGIKPNARNCGSKFGEKFHCSSNRMRDRHDFHSCRCNLHTDYRSKSGQPVPQIRSVRDFKTGNKAESALDISRPFYHGSRYNNGCYASDSCGVPKGKLATSNIPLSRGDAAHTKKIWEPMDSKKRYPRSNSDPDVTLRSSSYKADAYEGVVCNGNENGCRQPNDTFKSFDEKCSSEFSSNHEDGRKKACNSTPGMQNGCENGFSFLGPKSSCSKNAADDEVEMSSVISTFPFTTASDPLMTTSSSDNCSSWLSEGDSSIGSSGAQNAESSSTSDSEDASQQSEGREISTCGESTFHNCLDVGADGKYKTSGPESFSSGMVTDQLTKSAYNSENSRISVDACSEQQNIPPVHNESMHLPIFPTHSTVGYFHQCAASWAAAPTNGLVPFHQPNRYIYHGPLGYGVPSNPSSTFCMQYGTLQPLTAPMLNVGQVSSYQMANKASIVNSKDHTQNSKCGGAQESNGVDSVVTDHSLERPFSNRWPPQKAPPPGQDGGGRNPARSNNESPTFSLFHFGGPVAVAAGYNSKAVSLKDEVIGDLSLKSSVSPVQSTVACTKKDTTIEEYSLFSASNGARFSFF
ncbi:uncharacterized protein LOC131251660 isoform X2 [Magnolia sinica]|uniref:uncharacterized protein LOC131251660 isoform X2 n=1 Tax=Magnolia sinica TaxID=86752 RepID=UPI0026588023|nr:uncharacterized protein LOC131251660 isoform X2 [Magnolia sinica]